jgi:hypothetical protein
MPEIVRPTYTPSHRDHDVLCVCFRGIFPLIGEVSVSSLPVRVSALAAAALLAAGLSACSSKDKDACEGIKTALTDVSQQGLKQVSDPKALEKTYNDGAAKIREEAKDAGGDVKTAADKAATAMETLGKQVGGLGESSNPQIPDTSALTNAGKELQDACN